MASNLIAVVEAEVECRTRCMMRENSSKCRNVEQIFSKCRFQRLSSMMRGKRCFFFFEVSISEDFLSPVLLKKNVDRSKVHAPDVLKQRSSFLSTN